MFMFAFIDMFIDSIDYALQGETMGMHKVRIVSLSPKAVSEQDGIVEVPEETDFSGITSLNKTVPFKILSLERDHNHIERGGRKKHLLTS
ncbi:Dihydroorotate dehydrogenase A (fumarate) [Trichinella spiralis]|uniref:Dihydroorotate dehydrogenase A (Fumarate) n=1 Tax=Trichinella spiralis TaxID=6334 RepID=A0ABR3KJ40_TRISP